jgi:chaperonin cofactor prefoldin
MLPPAIVLVAIFPITMSSREILIQRQLEALEEAQNELMLVDDDDGVRYLFGECFAHTGNDDADSRLEDGADLFRQFRESLQVELHVHK